MLSTINSQPSTSVCLTDSPRVVELKREFERLDAQEETLKVSINLFQERLARIRARKAAIAREVFQP